MRGRGNKNIYAVYKGDEFIDEGTKDELATRLNVKRRTVDFWATGVAHRRNKGNMKIAICLGPAEEL